LADTDRSPKTVVHALVATTAVQAIVTMASLAVSVFAPQAARDIGVPVSSIGIYASVTYVGAMIGSLLAGGFILRYGAVRFSQVVMVVCAIGLLLCIGAHWWWFVLSAAILGLGYGPTTPASSYILSRHTPARMLSLVFSIKQTGVPLGGVLAGLIVPALLVYFDWRVVSAIVAAAVVVGALLLQLSRRRFDLDLVPTQPLLRGNVIEPLRLIFSRPSLRTLALGSFFFSATQQCYIYFLVTYLEVGIGWTTQHAGFALSVLGLSAVVGRMVWGAIADASGQSRRILGILALGMTATTLLTAGFTSDSSPWVVFAVCAAFGATGAAWNGIYLAEITRSVAPADVGYAIGGGLFVTFAGVVVTPPLFGLAISATGSFDVGYIVLACAGAIVSAAFLFGGPQESSPSSS
jgi:MFS family permease